MENLRETELAAEVKRTVCVCVCADECVINALGAAVSRYWLAAVVALLQWQETTQPVIFADSNGKFTQTEKKGCVRLSASVTESENICCCHLKIKVLLFV